MKKMFEKQILRFGKWNHPSAPNGVLEIDSKYGQQLVDNYSKSPYVPVLRGHIANSEAERNPDLIISNNIKALDLKSDGVYAKFEMEEKELEKYNDVSASILPSYTDRETGNKLGVVLEHVALVTNPFIKKLNGFEKVSLSEDNKYIIYLSEINMSEKKEETKVKEQKVEVETTETKKEEVVETKPETTETIVEEPKKEAIENSDSIRTELEEMKTQLAEVQAEKRKMEATNVYKDLLSKGKVLPTMENEIVQLASIQTNAIQLGEGQESVNTVITRLFEKMPTLVNLSEQGINLENGVKPVINLSEDVKKNAKETFLVSHPEGTEEQFNEWLKENEETYAQIK